ncbi:MAG: sigma-70 family RNA polymerase sigma factor [Oscillospiraceae bacterium]|nr:sigma-70 family RNA polymerase sigma factor [Oscillospiraceae bacterium]MBP1575125.1 sigma-70 family RNA polymerase sigma factor [Oscillospiraceae bacterium]MBQ5322735.1 sigma-70 family RNA polymerase sigma factor [Oscillospiraceae bacterium]MBQ8594691.1 sigma-70 family RNA polymerase sigma factor [Oscillospiraceae bacterium]
MSGAKLADSAVDREILITENMGLVHSCAHRFTGKGIEYEDLFQSGCMGLVKAFDAFDKERGVRFSTYAVPVILGEMRRLFRDGGTVKVSRSLKELSIKTTKERENFILKNGREPTVSELSEILEVSGEEVTEALCAAAPVVSLTIGEDEGGGQADVPVESPEDEITERLSVIKAVSDLEERDRLIIKHRYYENKTQTETAKLLGMTQVQVSRREKKILEVLRKELTG